MGAPLLLLPELLAVFSWRTHSGAATQLGGHLQRTTEYKARFMQLQCGSVKIPVRQCNSVSSSSTLYIVEVLSLSDADSQGARPADKQLLIKPDLSTGIIQSLFGTLQNCSTKLQCITAVHNCLPYNLSFRYHDAFLSVGTIHGYKWCRTAVAEARDN